MAAGSTTVSHAGARSVPKNAFVINSHSGQRQYPF